MPNVPPWISKVTSMTMKVINRIGSRYGKSLGSASAAAKLTAPRIPAQPITSGTEGRG